ncbi:MAG: MBL fold metallo-hydrolase [Promethearchaeota archaeon]
MEYIFEQLNARIEVDRRSSSSYCKTYLFGSDGMVAIVDPVLDEVNNYIALLEMKKITLTHIFETHTHADHISGAAAMKDRTGASLVMHVKAPVKCAEVESRVRGGDEFIVAGVPVRVIHTPGHTKDSISLVLPGKVLTGDALFLDEGGGGRDDLPGGDPGDHYDSLQKLMSLDGGLIVYPAHDYRDKEPSSLDSQRDTNPHVKKAMGSRDGFIDYITNLKLGPADWMKSVLTANYACALDPGDVWVPADASSCEVKGTLDFGANMQTVDPITPRDLRERLDMGRDMILLDVRESFELSGPLGKLDNVVNISITSLAGKLGELGNERGKEIVTICKIGGRSFTAGQILKQKGFKDVVYLEGGMIGWRNAYKNLNS